MRVATFSLLLTALAMVDALPVPFFNFVRDDSALSANVSSNLTDVPTATVNATDSVLSATAATATDSVDSSVATDSSLPSSATDSSSPVSATDSALATDTPSATDTALATDTPSAATDSTDADPTAIATPSSDISSFVLPTAVPVAPAACLAKVANIAPPSNTAAADPSTVSASTDSSSAAPSVSTGSSDVDSVSSSDNSTVASATDSALTSVPTGALTSGNDTSSTGDDTSSLRKRIAQPDLPAVAQSWQDLCLVSGGDIFTNEPCVNLAGINGINALLADADPCAQQDNADAMVDFAKSPGVTNADALIQNAIAYRKHPRNALDILDVTPSTPFCEKAPRNQELVGLVNDQLPGVNPGIFGGPTFGLVAFGEDGTCPFGSTPDVSTCSCVQSIQTDAASDDSSASTRK
ncbi:hypothetical protein BXZ70DRAFT_254622 [Cristinia sonorae]|uniref:Uncharacterized protein n=1 Tax=Cristinia sonorae TaxID=1940300 RepID=A0A8K0UWQ4_9AGAR|nr:hypothetical protein BXZ70DRAFT_254622 [Cristinia sonorae]